MATTATRPALPTQCVVCDRGLVWEAESVEGVDGDGVERETIRYATCACGMDYEWREPQNREG